MSKYSEPNFPNMSRIENFDTDDTNRILNDVSNSIEKIVERLVSISMGKSGNSAVYDPFYTDLLYTPAAEYICDSIVKTIYNYDRNASDLDIEPSIDNTGKWIYSDKQIPVKLSDLKDAEEDWNRINTKSEKPNSLGWVNFINSNIVNSESSLVDYLSRLMNKINIAQSSMDTSIMGGDMADKLQKLKDSLDSIVSLKGGNIDDVVAKAIEEKQKNYVILIQQDEKNPKKVKYSVKSVEPKTVSDVVNDVVADVTKGWDVPNDIMDELKNDAMSHEDVKNGDYNSMVRYVTSKFKDLQNKYNVKSATPIKRIPQKREIEISFGYGEDEKTITVQLEHKIYAGDLITESRKARMSHFSNNWANTLEDKIEAVKEAIGNIIKTPSAKEMSKIIGLDDAMYILNRYSKNIDTLIGDFNSSLEERNDGKSMDKIEVTPEAIEHINQCIEQTPFGNGVGIKALKAMIEKMELFGGKTSLTKDLQIDENKISYEVPNDRKNLTKPVFDNIFKLVNAYIDVTSNIKEPVLIPSRFMSAVLSALQAFGVKLTPMNTVGTEFDPDFKDTGYSDYDESKMNMFVGKDNILDILSSFKINLKKGKIRNNVLSMLAKRVKSFFDDKGRRSLKSWSAGPNMKLEPSSAVS